MEIKLLTFDTLGQNIPSDPVIVIHNIDGLELFYVKSRSAREKNGKWKRVTEGEILIRKSKNPNALFKNDFYLDCSQLFRIHKLDYDNLIENNKSLKFADTTQLSYKDVLRIFEKIKKLAAKIPPYIALSDISYDKNTNTIKSDLLYASNKHLDKDLNNSFKNNKFSNLEIEALTNLAQDSKNNKNLDALKIISDAVKKAEWDYEGEMIIQPLARWIEDNKLLEKGKTTKDIILEHNSLFEQGEKIAVRPIGVYDVVVIDSFVFANGKLESNDLNYAHDEFYQLYRLCWDFERFELSNKTPDGKPLFNFIWLKREFESFVQERKESEARYEKRRQELKAQSEARKMKM